ncbi:ethanolamine kinase isoform X2 [Drosophila biarmipes]|uniref:ethanolamine kinase isoform X2 n=1 Tax=Drosophila biarmipes TaxID=125945 RepID=UPI001CDAE5CC|nr:ethanolamine kinase isoform X2 [Drosophila biarmipes]
MGTETKSNSYTGQISTSGGNPKVMKDSLSLVRQTVNQQSQSNQVQNHLNSNSNSQTYPSESENENELNSRDIRAEQEDKSRKEAIVPFVPLFVEEADVIHGAKELLKVIRPTWDLSHVEFKIRVVRRSQIADRYPAPDMTMMTMIVSPMASQTNWSDVSTKSTPN